jgi:AAA ATPase domain
VPGLTDRHAECDVLCRLVAAVRAGESRALVVRGEPGVGKTALLEYLARQASGCRVAHAGGVQSEMELAFAVLHQLCAPMLDRLERLPTPQRDALRTAFGLSAGPAPDRFLIGLAALGLLSEMAGERPLFAPIANIAETDYEYAHSSITASARTRRRCARLIQTPTVIPRSAVIRNDCDISGSGGPPLISTPI